MVDIGGIKVARTGSRLLTAEDVAEVTEHIERLEAENAKLREMNAAMWLIIRCAIGEISAKDGLPVIHEDDLRMLRNMRRELGIETQTCD